MDIVDTCKTIIEEKFKELDSEMDESTQNTSAAEALGESDKNVTKILNQQAILKRIIDQDNSIQMLKNSLSKVALDIEECRSNCTRLNEEALRDRQELVQAQAKEIEKFQMAQIKSISEDYNRHQEILEHRKREIAALKREIEREEKGRGAYLADVEKKLEQQLQERQRAISGGSLPFGDIAGTSSSNQQNNNIQELELTSVDEYAPYGAAPHSRLPAARSSGRGGRGRGRRARRG